MGEKDGKEQFLDEKVRRAAIVLVHGIGDQKPLEFLREFTNALCAWINWCAGIQRNPQLVARVRASMDFKDYLANTLENAELVARVETIRDPNDQRGGEADILVGNVARIRVYEVYWADLGQAPAAGLFKSLRFSGWIIQALFRPVALTLNASPGCVSIWTALKGVLLVIPGFIFFLLDILTIAGRFIKRLSGISVSAQRALLAYAGDIRLYTSGEKQAFGREAKDEIVDRFRQTLSRAHEPKEGNDSIVIVAHSLGSVIAYDGLTQDDYVNPLNGTRLPPWPPTAGYPPVNKIAALFTLGSPLDKFNYFWPDRISMRPVSSAQEENRIWWGNFQDFLDPVGGNLNAYTRENWRMPYPCRGPYKLDMLFDGPHEYRLCNAYSPSRAHLIYWWSREFMKALTDRLNLKLILQPPGLPRTLLDSIFLRLRQAGKGAGSTNRRSHLLDRLSTHLQQAESFLTKLTASPEPTEPMKGPMVRRAGFWTVVVVAVVFLISSIWEKWLSDIYISKVSPKLNQGLSYVKEVAESVLSWTGLQQRGWAAFIFEDSYIIVSLGVLILLLLGVVLYTRRWTMQDIAAGLAGLILLVVMLSALYFVSLNFLVPMLLFAWLELSKLFPFLMYSPVWSCAIGAFVLSAISGIAIWYFLNRPLQLAESLRIIFNALVFSLVVFVGMVMAAWSWLTLLKFFTVSPKRATVAVLLLAVFLLLVVRMARLRRELGRSSIERMGDAFYE